MREGALACLHRLNLSAVLFADTAELIEIQCKAV